MAQKISEDAFRLQNLIKWLSYEKKIHICIHYFSGNFQEDPALSVLPQNKVHYCNFCNAAKLSSRGLSFCMKNKRRSISKALQIRQQYAGKCYLGITEIVKPVFIDSAPFCIIYVGNMITEENELEVQRQIHKMTKISGVSPQLLYTELKTLEKVSLSKLEEYGEIAQIISYFIELYVKSMPKALGSKSHKNSTDRIHWGVKQALNYIEQFYYTDIKLSHIADLYFINEQYLCKLFSRQAGESFSNYVNKIRIAKAKDLLASSGKKVIEIASNVGFSNVTYFNSVFKRLTGMTPKEFRASCS